MAATHTVSYRPDIDGLRAIAVLAVLFFHANVPGFEGGFIGVDMFFVISGYLITGIILRECRAKTFNFTDFYLRRVRRILPALVVMVATTLAGASLVLTSYDFKVLATNILATVLMIPNVSIWKTSGDYFSHAVDANPLLHLWSLGVEEQFYLLFPLILFFWVRHLRSHWLWVSLVTILFGGIAFAFWSISFKPTFAFYWLPPRAWELLCGSLLAYYHVRQQPTTKSQPWLAGVGFLMITAAIFINRDSSTYSDFAHQVLAIVGITLLIDGNTGREQTWINRFLAWQPLVAIGLISYSLYLWHWPLFSLYSYRMHPTTTHWYETLVLFMVTFVLAYGSWRYVETPFRRQWVWETRPVIKFTLGMQIALAIAAVGVLYTKGFPQRFGAFSNAYSAGAEDKNPMQKDCHIDPYSSEYHFPDIDKCVIGQRTDPKAPINFLVWGDSHANAISPVFDALGKKYGLKGLELTLIGHVALWGVKSADENSSEHWMQFNQRQLKVINERNIHDVFLVGRWASYVFAASKFEGSLGKNGIPSQLIRGSQKGLPAFRAGLEETVQRLQQLGIRVWLVLPIPEMDRIVPRWLALHITNQADVWLNNPYPERAKAVLPVFKDLQEQYGVHLLDPIPYLCQSNGKCIIAHNGKSVYYDDDHLSASGSLLLGEMLKPAFDTMVHSPRTL